VRVYYDRGIIVEADGEKLYLDPELASTPSKYHTLVTHAHSDHTAAVSGGTTTHLTQTTLDLYRASTTKNPRNYKIVNFREPFELGPFEVEYRNAGHLLGAAQILIRHGSTSFLYTGDFCPEDLLTVKGADMPNEQMDLTLIDSTYGDQDIKLDNRQQSRQNLFIWVLSILNKGQIPCLNVGPLGGAQELIRFFNQIMSTLPIIVSDKIDSISQVFMQEGVDLRYTTYHDEEIGSLVDGKCLFIVERSNKHIADLEKRFPHIQERLCRAIVTGQTAKYGFNAFSFTSSLSTHAHFDELITTTKQLNPKHVLTHYGHPEKFAKSLIDQHNISASSFAASTPTNIQDLDRKKPTVKRPSYLKHRPLDEFF
jgi:Cft2 family RNA processing exonuclease